MLRFSIWIHHLGSSAIGAIQALVPAIRADCFEAGESRSSYIPLRLGHRPRSSTSSLLVERRICRHYTLAGTQKSICSAGHGPCACCWQGLGCVERWLASKSQLGSLHRDRVELIVRKANVWVPFEACAVALITWRLQRGFLGILRQNCLVRIRLVLRCSNALNRVGA